MGRFGWFYLDSLRDYLLVYNLSELMAFILILEGDYIDLELPWKRAKLIIETLYYTDMYSGSI